MRVLSIDWDFFQDITIEVLKKYYPDGYDCSTKMSEMVWADAYVGAYLNDNVNLKNSITLAYDEYDAITTLLLNQNKNCKVIVANSHVCAYEFILNNLSPNEKIQLINIDMHHDMINNNHKVDCGNWIGKLAQEKRIATNSLKWISNKISFDMYGLHEDCGNNDELNTKFRMLIDILDGGNSVSVLNGQEFDLIILARSDPWSAPHLDNYFCDLVNKMCHHFKNITLEKGIDKSRTNYRNIALQLFNDAKSTK